MTVGIVLIEAGSALSWNISIATLVRSSRETQSRAVLRQEVENMFAVITMFYFPPEPEPEPEVFKQKVEVGATFSSTLSVPTILYLNSNLAKKMEVKPNVFKIFNNSDCTSLTMEFGDTTNPSLALRVDGYRDAINAALNAAKEDEASELTAEWSFTKSIVTINV
jgi:hypothetical protein